MTLYDICKSISDVAENLSYGLLDYSNEELMEEIKARHPSEILNKILSIIGKDVFKGRTPEREKIEKVYLTLKQFQDIFNIDDLNDPIDSLEKYLYSRIILKFPIYINEGRESFIEYAVTEKMYQKIMKAKYKGYPMRRSYGLEDLYDELMIAANDKLNYDEKFVFKDIDYVDLDFYIDFPKSMED